MAAADRSAQLEMDQAETDAAQSIDVASLGDFVPNVEHGARAGRCRTMGGIASWYGPASSAARPPRRALQHRRPDRRPPHAALRTMVRVSNTKTGRSSWCASTIAPYVGGRVIDFVAAAARSIGEGVPAHVSLEALPCRPPDLPSVKRRSTGYTSFKYR